MLNIRKDIRPVLSRNSLKVLDANSALGIAHASRGQAIEAGENETQSQPIVSEGEEFNVRLALVLMQ